MWPSAATSSTRPMSPVSALRVMLSPEAGRWVCDLITGAMPPEQNPLRLSRFKEGAVVAGSSSTKTPIFRPPES